MNKMYRKSIFLFTGILVLFSFACNVTFTTSFPTPTNVPPTQIPTATATSTPLLSQQVTLTSVPFIETNPGSTFPQYTLTASTPQLSGSDDPRVTALNQRLNGIIAKEVDMWRQNFQQLPITPYSNGSSLEVKYTLVSQIGDLWSFKFDFSFYSDTAAHPGLYSITLNYDLGQGRELTLGDIFLPNSNYLEAISTYCITELKKQPYSDSFFLGGANPTTENYRSWNITADGLMIIFDQYQVAPGASGPQIVMVPYEQLSAEIDPQGPLKNIP